MHSRRSFTVAYCCDWTLVKAIRRIVCLNGKGRSSACKRDKSSGGGAGGVGAEEESEIGKKQSKQ